MISCWKKNTGAWSYWKSKELRYSDKGSATFRTLKYYIAGSSNSISLLLRRTLEHLKC
jgi:hypothetical protein